MISFYLYRRFDAVLLNPQPLPPRYLYIIR